MGGNVFPTATAPATTTPVVITTRREMRLLAGVCGILLPGTGAGVGIGTGGVKRGGGVGMMGGGGEGIGHVGLGWETCWEELAFSNASANSCTQANRWSQSLVSAFRIISST